MAQYRVVKAAMVLLEEARAAHRPLPRPVLRQAREAAAALVALVPDWPRYLLLHAEVCMASHDLAAAAVGLQRVIDAATAQKGEGGSGRVGTGGGWRRAVAPSHTGACRSPPCCAGLPGAPSCCLSLAAHYWAGQGAMDLAMLHMSGGLGPTFEVATVRRLLDDAERDIKLSRQAAGGVS